MDRPLRVLFASHVPLVGSGSGSYIRYIAQQVAALGHLTVTVAPTSVQRTSQGYSTSLGTPDQPERYTFPFSFPTFSEHRDSGLLYNDLTDQQVARYVDTWVTCLTELNREFRPDVIHINHAFLLGYCACAAGVAPYVICSHGSEFERGSYNRFDRYVRAGIDAAADFAAVSGRIAAKLEERARRPVAVIPPGFDPITFTRETNGGTEMLQSMGLRASDPVVGYVGRLVPYKRAADLLHALRLISARRRPEAVIIGSGPEAALLRALADELGSVVVHDHLDDPRDVAKILAALSLVVLPADYEPFPMVGLEALACGTPVVASDRGGVADLVADVAGAVFPCGQISELARLIEQALEEDWKGTRGLAGPDRVANHHWDFLARRFVSLYERTVDSSSAKWAPRYEG